ncbi:MAG: PriCT-2 domain-containing protein [Bacteroidaceae bacterium]|nr:PriCT-2 domain-containing protein [Bacteroidaceae bacterium]
MKAIKSNSGSAKNSSDFFSNLAHVKIVIERTLNAGVDLTSQYDDWVSLGFAFANLGEDGRPFFHDVSRLHPGYNRQECDAKFTNCLEANRRREAGEGCKDTYVKLGTFFKMAADRGIDISMPEELKPKVGRPRKSGEGEDKPSAVEMALSYLCNTIDTRYNVINNIVEFRPKDDKGTLVEGWQRMDDRNFATIYSRLRVEKISIRENDLRSLLYSIDNTPSYNPVEEYFDSLPEWDGETDYIEQLFDYIIFESQEDRDFCLPLLKKWFVCAVALVLGKTDDNQVVPVLVGSQHIGKTFFCRHLLPPSLRSYLNTLMPGDSLDDKDVRISMSEFVFIILDEFTLNRHTSNQMKAIVSSSESKLRRAYGRFRETFKRFCSFIATSNEPRYINQPEGDRRYLTVMMKGTKQIDDSLPLDGAYAQACALVKRGDPTLYRTSPEESALISRRNKEHNIPSLCDILVPLYFRIPTPAEQGVMMTAGEIFFEMSTFKSPELNAVNIGKTLNRMKFHHRRTSQGEKYYVMRVNLSEREELAKQEGMRQYQEIIDALKQEQEREEEKRKAELERQQTKIDFDALYDEL